MRKLRNIIRLCALLLAGPFPAVAEGVSWTPLIGKWRAADYGSCGVDDLRFGRITGVSEDALLTDKIHCTIESGAATENGYTMEAICEVGVGYYAVLNYDWRLISDTEAVLSQDGYERRLIRCEGEVE